MKSLTLLLPAVLSVLALADDPNVPKKSNQTDGTTVAVPAITSLTKQHILKTYSPLNKDWTDLNVLTFFDTSTAGAHHGYLAILLNNITYQTNSGYTEIQTCLDKVCAATEPIYYPFNYTYMSLSWNGFLFVDKENYVAMTSPRDGYEFRNVQSFFLEDLQDSNSTTTYGKLSLYEDHDLTDLFYICQVERLKDVAVISAKYKRGCIPTYLLYGLEQPSKSLLDKYDKHFFSQFAFFSPNTLLEYNVINETLYDIIVGQDDDNATIADTQT